MEKNPWYKNVEGPFLQWKGPVGVKEDGGGCTRGQGRVGNMVVNRAAFNKNKEGTVYISWYKGLCLVLMVAYLCCSNSKGS